MTLKHFILLFVFIFLSTKNIYSTDINGPNHPDYPSKVIMDIMDKNYSPEIIIQKIEALISQTNFVGLSENNKDGTKLIIGTKGSFILWRELGYLLLGRAYYEQKDFDKSTHYFSGIPKDSPLFNISRIEKTWAELQSKKAIEANISNSEIEVKKLSSDLKKEYLLQKAYIFHLKKDYKKIIDIISTLSFDPKDPLYVSWQKLYIQTEFENYLLHNSEMPLEQKQKILEETVSRIETLNPSDIDTNTAFLCSDVYWNYSSLLRIQDPVKNEIKWKNSLFKANNILTPWIGSLSEEAMFLSIAILWEQEKKAEAIPRLNLIIKSFPQGKYREDSYQLLGDYYYNNGDFKTALEYYRKLSHIGSKTKAAYGVYKAAWAFYNVQKKWGALRHLERLVSFYKKGETGSLSNESEKDMLTILAELTPFHDAISELNIFKYEQKEMLIVIEKLAISYKEIGKYEDSINTWQHLLDRYNKEDKATDWLIELLNTLLSAGRRKDIAPTLDKYITILPTNNRNKLAAEYAKITLLINKEAKKTDDIDIWAATDSLYLSFFNNFENYNKGDIWLFGAQRKEMLQQKWEAIRWYQKAANIKDYEGSIDSALSVLKILKSIMDVKSLDEKKKDITDYKNVALYSKWYIDNFKDTPQKELAENIYIEALFYIDGFDEAQNYILAGNINIYRGHNKRLYSHAKWKEAYNLALAIYKSQLKIDDNLKKEMERVLQETSFQKGFIDKDRNWYLLSIRYPFDNKIYLKSWHNYLLTFDIETESEKLLIEYKKFINSFKSEKIDFEEKELLLNIYSLAVRMYTKLNMPIFKARALILIAGLSDEEKEFDLRWDALMIFASYGQYSDMEAEISTLSKVDSSKFSDKKLLLSKLYLYNGMYKQSWDLLNSLISNSSPESLITLRDLYYDTKANDDKLNTIITAYLLENKNDLIKNNILSNLYYELLFDDYKKITDNLVSELHYKLEDTGESTIDPVEELKRRLQYIKNSSKTLNIYLKSINEEANKWEIKIPVLALEATKNCFNAAISNFTAMKTPAIKIEEWNTFVTSIDNAIITYKHKINEVNNQYKTLSNDLYYLTNENKKVVLVSNEKPIKDSIIDLENKWKTKPIDDFDQIIELLKSGAWTKAEMLATTNTNIYKKSLLLALIRLENNDTWNALPLINKAEENKKLSNQILLLKAIVAKSKNIDTLKTQFLKGIDASKLSEVQKQVYSNI